MRWCTLLVYLLPEHGQEKERLTDISFSVLGLLRKYALINHISSDESLSGSFSCHSCQSSRSRHLVSLLWAEAIRQTTNRHSSRFMVSLGSNWPIIQDATKINKLILLLAGRIVSSKRLSIDSDSWQWQYTLTSGGSHNEKKLIN